MNDKFKQLAEQAEVYYNDGEYQEEDLMALQKFAELIVQECINTCKQEWYDLNNAPTSELETSRDIAFRVGQKAGIILCMNKLHYKLK